MTFCMTFFMHEQKACIHSPQQARPYAHLATRLGTRFHSFIHSLIHSFNSPQQAAAWGGSDHLQS